MESYKEIDIEYDNVLNEIKKFIQKISDKRGVDIISVSHSITCRANPYRNGPLKNSFLAGYLGSCIIIYQE